MRLCGRPRRTCALCMHVDLCPESERCPARPVRSPPHNSLNARSYELNLFTPLLDASAISHMQRSFVRSGRASSIKEPNQARRPAITVFSSTSQQSIIHSRSSEAVSPGCTTGRLGPADLTVVHPTGGVPSGHRLSLVRPRNS